MVSNWIFLSYTLSDRYSSYGDGERIDIRSINCIADGSSNNSSRLIINSHFGTHIDFPFHFNNEGKMGEKYSPEKFVCNSVMVVHFADKSFQDWVITSNDFNNLTFSENTELLLIKTGLCEKRLENDYWEKYPGLHSDLAEFFKDKMPNLKAVGLDTMSISSWQNRPMGRIAHKSFLIDHNILIIEDMDLSKINQNDIIETVIISPLRFDNSDGSPTTIFAKIKSK